ncbi:hypothetical protein ACTXT7_007683 [Hymenolepis weldensis]
MTIGVKSVSSLSASVSPPPEKLPYLCLLLPSLGAKMENRMYKKASAFFPRRRPQGQPAYLA